MVLVFCGGACVGERQVTCHGLAPRLLQVPLERVFGSGVHKVVAHLNIEGQHRGAVAAARAAADVEHLQACGDSSCSHEAHAHHHHHTEHHSSSTSCQHDHQHQQHSDEHEHKHEHSHGHNHKEHADTRAATRFGIKSFVYHKRRPFHLKRCVLLHGSVTNLHGILAAAH